MPQPSPRAWYRIENQADPAVADIYIIDLIGDWIDDYWGFGVTAKAFVAELAKLPDAVKTIRLHVNSPGGDVFGAVNIANALRDQRASKGRVVDVLIEGLAASAASIVIMAGTTIRIGDNALVMVHNPWWVAIGESKDMRKVADDLDTIRGAIIATYRWHSKLSEEELGALMDATTWMGADDAIANGFATEKVAGLQAAASLAPKIMAKLPPVPDKYKARLAALTVKATAKNQEAVDPDEVLAAVAEAGLGIDFARELIVAALPLDQVQARVTAAKQEREAAAARAKEIRALCAMAKLPTLADGYIRGSMAVADVKAHLTTITAKQDNTEIDGGLRPDGDGAGPRSKLNVVDFYRELNQAPTTAKGASA